MMNGRENLFNLPFIIHHSSFIISLIETATRPGFEPGQREPKSLVLPLHYRVIASPPSFMAADINIASERATLTETMKDEL
jgi:hypothetical protein